MNAAGALYDTDSFLREFVLSNRPDRSETFVQGLIGDIQRFVGSAPQADDITAMYLMRT